MPRVRQKAEVYCNQDFSKVILSRLALLGLQQHDLAVHLGVCDGTVSLMLKNPQKIPTERLRMIIAFLDLDPMDVLLFFGFRKKQIREKMGKELTA